MAFHTKQKYIPVKEEHRTTKKCFNCEKVGHFAAKCRSRIKKRSSESENTKAFLTLTTTDTTKSRNWYLDSCAFSHMTPYKETLHNLFDVDANVTTSNNHAFSVKGKGDANIQITVNCGRSISKEI